MPNTALLEVISHLDQAVSHAESGTDSLFASQQAEKAARDQAIRESIAQIDALIALLRADTAQNAG